MNCKNTALRLLVVEDNPLQCLDLKMSLSEMGHEVVGTARHVTGALAAVRNFGSQLDCVVLDVMLSGETAHAVTDELDRRGIRYVAVTGLRDADLAKVGIDCPTVSKPFSRGAISSALAETLERAPV